MLLADAATLPPPFPALGPEPRPTERADLHASWATTWAEVREAQRLRHRVFSGELGASLPMSRYGLDADEFDAHCDHLLVRDGHDGPVIGTYRVLLPEQARAAGGLYSDTEFDLSSLSPIRARLAELGRACVDARFRHGGALVVLWGALAEYMADRRIDWLLGCCSLPLQPSPRGPAVLWKRLNQTHATPAPWRARPLLPLPLDGAETSEACELPSLLRGYLRLGAKVMGPPAWDSAFRCADLPLLLSYDDLPERFRRRRLAWAA
ncbi:MAG: GNAT family N-acyltransferase [Burkholderiaceae bacterium]